MATLEPGNAVTMTDLQRLQHALALVRCPRC